MSKKSGVSVYGVVRIKTRVQKQVRQRYWKKRSDGIRQRYWKTTKRTVSHTRRQGRRINVYGSPEEVAQALEKIHSESLVPQEQFVSVSALDLITGVPEIKPEGVNTVWDTQPEEDES